MTDVEVKQSLEAAAVAEDVRITFDQMSRDMSREVEMRKAVYFRRVVAGQMSLQTAEHQLRVAGSILRLVRYFEKHAVKDQMDLI